MTSQQIEAEIIEIIGSPSGIRALASAIEGAIEVLRQVRTGTDFECEYHDAARALTAALGEDPNEGDA